jgi:hypothetical protein
MSKLFPQKSIIIVPLLLVLLLAGCTHQKTKRGHLFRGDWAFEYNRTPWIGCPTGSDCPDAECQDVGKTKSRGLFACLKKDSNERNRKGLRRHCAMNAGCTQKNPCCRTLGCGMWIDSDDSVLPASLGGSTRACGLTPFCFPHSPCRLVPNCGKPMSNPQTLALADQQALSGLGGMGIVGGGINGGGINGTVNGMTNGMPTVRGMSPGGGINPNRVMGTSPAGTYVSRGIVPGASAITSGGMVAAIGVATPAGTMMPTGVRLPNGALNNNIVLRACVMSPNCTAAHPCGLTPHCGGAVAVNLVANNAIALASALQAQGGTSRVMQTGGMGMLVNPMTNQPINGLTMSGYTQAGYPPIGYAPTGYAPGYPRYAVGMLEGSDASEEVYDEAEETIHPETRSAMPVPRFHPVPSKPVFQRSEGMAPTPATQRPESQRTVAKPTTIAMAEQREVSEQELEAALDRAYLEGVSAAMNEVERKLETKRQTVAKVKLQEKILQQAEHVQQQLDEQEQLQMLAMQRMQRERQLRQQMVAQQAAAHEAALQQAAVEQATMQRAEMLTAATTASIPKRLPPKQAATPQNPPQNLATARTSTNTNVNPVQLAENLKTSVASGVSGVFAPLLGSNQTRQSSATPLPRNRTESRELATPETEIASTQIEVPVRPPVLPTVPKHGLLPDDDSESLILQAQFSADDVPIRP